MLLEDMARTTIGVHVYRWSKQQGRYLPAQKSTAAQVWTIKKARPSPEFMAFRAAFLLGLSPVICTELFVLLASYMAQLSKSVPFVQADAFYKEISSTRERGRYALQVVRFKQPEEIQRGDEHPCSRAEKCRQARCVGIS